MVNTYCPSKFIFFLALKMSSFILDLHLGAECDHRFAFMILATSTLEAGVYLRGVRALPVGMVMRIQIYFVMTALSKKQNWNTLDVFCAYVRPAHCKCTCVSISDDFISPWLGDWWSTSHTLVVILELLDDTKHRVWHLAQSVAIGSDHTSSLCSVNVFFAKNIKLCVLMSVTVVPFVISVNVWLDDNDPWKMWQHTFR